MEFKISLPHSQASAICPYPEPNQPHILGVFCSLGYPACNAHAPCHTVICGLYGCTIFFHIIS